MSDILPVAFLILLAVVTVAVIWLLGVNRRLTTHDASYRELLDRAVQSQEATERRLGEMFGELSRINERVGTVERILKDAE